MTESKTATVNVPEDLLRPIIEAKVVEALGGAEGLTKALVRAALNQRVKLNYNTEISFIESVCNDSIKAATQEAVKTWIANNQAALTEAIGAELVRRKKSIATALVNGFASRASSGYSIRIAVALEDKDA